MTLVLTAVTPHYIVQTADRLLTKGVAVHDPVANKTIVCSAKDGIMVLSYSGVAYLACQPTDEWLAEILWGDTIARGRDGNRPATIMMARRPNDWTIYRTIAVLKQRLDSIPQRTIDQGALHIAIAGWRISREPPRPFLIEVQRERRTRAATVSGTPRRQRLGQDFVVARIGADIAPSELKAAFDRYRPGRTLNASEVERTFVEQIRLVASRNRTVGPNVLCTTFPIGGPAICRFHPAAPHATRVVHADGEITMPVAHTPWILSSNGVQSPQMTAGQSTSNLDWCPLIFDAPMPSGGVLGIAASMTRPAP